METKEYRSQMMSKIRSTGGKAEVMLAKSLWHRGIRYRKNLKTLPGKPDIAITKHKIAIFVDGEFWHGYDWDNLKHIRPKKNREYWIPKIEGNMKRDREVNTKLLELDWLVFRFWERRQVKKNLEECLLKIETAILYRTYEEEIKKIASTPQLESEDYFLIDAMFYLME